MDPDRTPSVGIGTQPWADRQHPPRSPFLHREAWQRAGACLRQPQVGHGHGHQITTLGPGIVLSTFSCPCSPGVAWHGSHYASSAWLMGHFGMTQPPQANSMPPADGSLNAGTGQKARTLSSNAKTAKCALVPGEQTPGSCPESWRKGGRGRLHLGKLRDGSLIPDCEALDKLAHLLGLKLAPVV